MFVRARLNSVTLARAAITYLMASSGQSGKSSVLIFYVSLLRISLVAESTLDIFSVPFEIIDCCMLMPGRRTSTDSETNSQPPVSLFLVKRYFSRMICAYFLSFAATKVSMYSFSRL